MASVRDIAAFIERELGPLSAYRVQKLVYYAQAWSLAWDGKPLFPNVIKAWKDGPVSPELWHARRDGLPGNPDALSPEQVATVQAVLDFYGQLSAQQLIDLSHREAPWREAREGCAPGDPGHTAITHEAMRDYYGPITESGCKRVPDSMARTVELLLSVPEDRIEDLLLVDQDVDGDAVVRWLETGESEPWDGSLE